jgi:death-on-curing protein
LATEQTVYLRYEDAVLIHIRLMQALGETRYGVDFRELLDSALARPKNEAEYNNGDVIRQAASLCFGLVKNHPWRGGNKRTATTLMLRFLELNGYARSWTVGDQIEMVLAVESDEWKVDEIEAWLRSRTSKV